MVTLVPTWISPEPGDSGPPLGPTRSWGHWSSNGPHLDLVNLVPILSSLSPGVFVPQLDLIALHSFLASLELMTLILTGPHPDLLTLVLTLSLIHI